MAVLKWTGPDKPRPPSIVYNPLMGLLADNSTPPRAADPLGPPQPTSDGSLRLLEPLVARILRKNPEYQRFLSHRLPGARLADFVIATADCPHTPAEVAARLRWGGLFVFAAEESGQVEEVARQFASTGFVLEEGPAAIRQGFWGLPLPLLTRKIYYFIARKVLLIPPGQSTERFTYQVQIAPHPDPAEPRVVLKEVPSLESVIWRLQRKFPDVPMETLERRARKFTEKIFPTFLTREAGILMVLQEHLPTPYHRRVPRPIAAEKDERGFVHKLKMSWLRNGGPPLSQMEFAHQSADLLRMIHDIARVIHLDLRLDNFVVTEHGVGFVDFGSAVRDDEDLSRNPLLSTLFDELMHTSQIQRMLNQMSLSGHVTSDIIRRSHHKPEKAIDFFYLAVQFNHPHSNPDLVDLIHYAPESPEAQQLSRLTAEILRPADPANPTYRSAKDILHGIKRLRSGRE